MPASRAVTASDSPSGFQDEDRCSQDIQGDKPDGLDDWISLRDVVPGGFLSWISGFTRGQFTETSSYVV
jgi:hypothetical protein